MMAKKSDRKSNKTLSTNIECNFIFCICSYYTYKSLGCKCACVYRLLIVSTNKKKNSFNLNRSPEETLYCYDSHTTAQNAILLIKRRSNLAAKCSNIKDCVYTFAAHNVHNSSNDKEKWQQIHESFESNYRCIYQIQTK